MANRRGVRGSAILEFTLCGIPLMFVWISIVQMAIGMWHYDSIQYAVKICGAYIAVHGATYVSQGNSAIQIKDAASVLASNAIGIPTNGMSVTFTAFNSSGGSTTHTCQLNTCLTDATPWPPSGYNEQGDDLEIKADYLWQSAIAMVAPGPGAMAQQFNSFHLPGYTHQFILF